MQFISSSFLSQLSDLATTFREIIRQRQTLEIFTKFAFRVIYFTFMILFPILCQHASKILISGLKQFLLSSSRYNLWNANKNLKLLNA